MRIVFWLMFPLFAVQANAQVFEYGVPGDGALWCPLEICEERWEEYKLTFDVDRGWFCRSKNRFCQTDGGGCGCSTSDPNTQTTWDGHQSWEMTGRLGGVAIEVVDYEAEINEYVVDVCYLEGIRRRGDVDLLGDEQQALEIMRILNAEQIDELVGAVRPLVVDQDRATRMTVYEIGAAACTQATQ